jgi:hypothetical protein
MPPIRFRAELGESVEISGSSDASVGAQWGVTRSFRGQRWTDKDGAMPRNVSLDWWPESEEDYEVARKELKKRFARWRSDEADGDGAEAPIHYKWAYVDGHLTRWRCQDLDQVYLELHPAKVIVDDDEVDGVLEEAKQFITFLAETDLLDPDSDPSDVLLAHLDTIEGQFRINMTDPSLYSFGKRLWSTARAEGVRMDDQASVNAFITNFNARPLAERDAVLGRGLPKPAASGRFTPPGTRPKAPSAKRRKRRH